MAGKLSALSKFSYKPKAKKPTGIDPLDTILNGGPEEGDLICLASKQGGGKSTLLLQLSKIYIEEYGMKVAYVDAERGVKQEILENMDLFKHIESGMFYLTNQVSTYTDIQDVVDEILLDDKFGMLVIDSTSQLTPTKLVEADIEAQQIALKARALSAFIDKYRGKLANANIITFGVAQYRKNLNQSFYGASEYNTSAPMSFMHAADVILHITTSQAKDRKIFAKVKTPNGEQEVSVGATHHLWAEKNKHAIPGIKVNFPVLYGLEISNLEYLKRLIDEKGLYTKSGASWYSSIGGIECKVNGKIEFQAFIEKNYETLREKLFNDNHYNLLSFEAEEIDKLKADTYETDD